MPGGDQAGGMALDNEVGLFAIKSDVAQQLLQPFDAAHVRVDLMQLAPLALYNLARFDLLGNLPPENEYNRNESREWVCLLSMGTIATDAVFTDGFRIWQRNIPIGGNHFTQAISKELKLTFAKAEQMKRNAARNANAKLLYQAMRPVFNDFCSEVQRSIAFFTSVHRVAEVRKIHTFGPALSVPGMQVYLEKNLALPVQRADRISRQTGEDALPPELRERLPSLAVCYGLAVQGLKMGRLDINLLPEKRQRRQHWRSVLGLGRSLIAAVRGADSAMCAMLGKENTILHNFARFVLLLLLIAGAYWFLGRTPGPESGDTKPAGYETPANDPFSGAKREQDLRFRFRRARAALAACKARCRNERSRSCLVVCRRAASATRTASGNAPLCNA